MNVAPRLHQPDAPPRQPARWSVAPSWFAAGVIILGSLALLSYVGAVVAGDARQAARECREAAESLRQARREMEEQRRLNDQAMKEVLVRMHGAALKTGGRDGD